MADISGNGRPKPFYDMVPILGVPKRTQNSSSRTKFVFVADQTREEELAQAKRITIFVFIFRREGGLEMSNQERRSRIGDDEGGSGGDVVLLGVISVLMPSADKMHRNFHVVCHRTMIRPRTPCRESMSV